MTADDLAIVVRGMTPVVREYVDAQVAPLLKTIADLKQQVAVAEQRPMTPGPAGKDAPVVEIDLAELAKQAAALIPVPENGKDAVVDVDAIAKAAAALIDTPKDGRDGRDADPVDVPAIVKQVTDGITVPTVDVVALANAAALLVPTPENGKDAVVDPLLLSEMVASEVTKAIATIERPKDGSSVTVDDVAPLIAAEVRKAVDALPTPKDGVGIVEALQDRDGHLRLTLSDGQTKDVGPIAGRDVDMVAVANLIRETLASWPKPTNGVDGKDGVGFDDLSFDHDEHGRLVLKFQRGDVVKTALVPCFVDRGVWRQGDTYLKGDSVTWGGSVFIAQVDDPTTKPETSKEWRLAVKRGDKGSPGQNGQDGTPGRDGKDFSQPSPTRGRF